MNGPYIEDGSRYLVRVVFNFMDGESSDGNWWSVLGDGPEEEAQAGLDNLNGAFNQYGIYFLPYGGSYCEGAAYYNTFTEADLPPDTSVEQSLKMSRGSYQPQDEIDNALNIYVLPPLDSPVVTGNAHFIPNNYAWVKGYSLSEGLATRSATLVHEVGHALGLLHPHAADATWECDEGAPNDDLDDCEPMVSISYCCGDYVAETPYYTNSSFVNVGAGCGNPGHAIPEILIRNYMSYIKPGSCRYEFLGEQVSRMKKYLRELHTPAYGGVNLLKNLQYLSVYPGELPTGLTGNFTVESGACTLTEPLQMLPGATIRVKHGATLRVQTKLTKACAGLWGGIVVEQGGRVFLQGQQAVVEHAVCGIYVDGGGEAQVWGGKLQNNETGMWLQSNNAQAAEGRVMFADFLVTDGYEGQANPPELLRLNNVEQLEVAYTEFSDERSPCPAAPCPSRAQGIYAEESSFYSRSNDFSLLNSGVWVNNMAYEYGAPAVRQCDFENTVYGVVMEHTAGFTVEGNTFTFNDALETYPPASKKVYGVYIRGLSEGFEVVENDFTNLHLNTAVYVPYGTYCDGTGAGLGNLIGHNNYYSMLIGNEAEGQNADMNNGLLYVCNNHDPELEGPEGSSPPDEVVDYKISGAIRNPQADLSDADEILPTGNIFSPSSDPEIENTSGISFQYYYDGNFSNQTPNSSTGIELEELTDVLPEEYCIDTTCPPPCAEYPVTLKDRFWGRQHLQDSLSKLLAEGGGSAYMEDIAEQLRRARWQKDKAAGEIIRYYAQDTLQALPDSIGKWLGRAGTYGAAYLLARQAFFKGELSSFDSRWADIPSHFVLSPSQSAEYESLDELFELLRPHFAEGGAVNSLPRGALDTLFGFTGGCNEAGHLSATLLRRNKALDGAGQPCSGAPALQASRRPQNEEAITKQASKGNEVRIFPNPAQGAIQIMLPPEQEAGHLRVYNLQGQRLLERTLTGRLSKLDIPLPSGIYLFAVQRASNGAPFWQKIIIQ